MLECHLVHASGKGLPPVWTRMMETAGVEVFKRDRFMTPSSIRRSARLMSSGEPSEKLDSHQGLRKI